LLGILLWINREEPTCFDQLKNGEELGIDCGGSCIKVCDNEASDLIVRWARAFKVRDGIYDLVAVIENPNVFGLSVLDYEFRVFDTKNLPIKEVQGATYLNARQQTIIFQSDIDVGFRKPDRTFLEIKTEPEWQRLVDVRVPQIIVKNKKWETATSSLPRIEATLMNSSFFDVGRLEVFALVRREDGNVIAISRTFLPGLPAGQADQVVFTWSEDFEEPIAQVDIVSRLNLVDDFLMMK